MNKQDKIKKVMREFKDGKLKTPNGEIVTDKKQALAIAMSESEDYAEKADLIEDISIGSLSDAEDVIKGIGSEELFEKAVYADTAENRKLGRVGQEYHRGKGTKKEDKKKHKYDIKDLTVNDTEKQREVERKYGVKLFGYADNSLECRIESKKEVSGLKKFLKDCGLKFNSEKLFRMKGVHGTHHYEYDLSDIIGKKSPGLKSDTEVKKAVDDEMGISDAYRELFGENLEKAHQDGDIHPKHPDWVWVSSASGGKGDWRKLNGRAHKKHTETQASNKFLENFKDASDDVLNKIVSGKIQAVDRERKLAQQILDSRKKSTQDNKQSSTTQNAHVQKLIDAYKMSNNSYTDTSKMSITITPKGNWNLRYDGKDVSTISGHIIDRKTLEAAGIKFEESKKRPVGAGTNGPTPKTKADKKVK